MEPQVLGPYVISHIVAVIYVFVAWRWPRVARWIAGVGFILAGVFNIWTVSTSPEAYVEGFGRYAIPLYRRFIYGDFARHAGAFVVAIAGGQIAVGALAFAPLPWRRLGYLGAIVFLLAITPLGIGSAAPSTLIFAARLILLCRERQAQ